MPIGRVGNGHSCIESRRTAIRTSPYFQLSVVDRHLEWVKTCPGIGTEDGVKTRTAPLNPRLDGALGQTVVHIVFRQSDKTAGTIKGKRVATFSCRRPGRAG